ncbi:MAG TPA: hypothetical protein VF832_03170 [Longimicrobiales bacterium]
MSRSLWVATVSIALASLPGAAAAQKPVEVSTQQAASVKGKQATVCGEVASAHLAMRTGGAPTFINFDKPNPDQTFTALIWGIDRPKFPAPPESTFTAGKRVCVTGMVTDFKGKPEIVVHGPDEIRLADK